MADVTMRLIWYRLGESYTNLADKYERLVDWYSDFSWRKVDILDMLFLGWLAAAFIVVGLINIYLRFRLKPAGSGLVGRGGPEGVRAPGAGESCQWVNSLLSWLYLHYEHTPEFVDCWLKALNDQARKQTVSINRHFITLPSEYRVRKCKFSCARTLFLFGCRNKAIFSTPVMAVCESPFPVFRQLRLVLVGAVHSIDICCPCVCVLEDMSKSNTVRVSIV